MNITIDTEARDALLANLKTQGKSAARLTIAGFG